MDYKKEYERWRSYATDNDIKAELEKMDDAITSIITQYHNPATGLKVA